MAKKQTSKQTTEGAGESTGLVKVRTLSCFKHAAFDRPFKPNQIVELEEDMALKLAEDGLVDILDKEP